MDQLIELLKFEAQTIRREFLKASMQGEGTSQEIAEFRENAVQAFLQRFYPYPYKVTKGKVFDAFGSISPSIDCLLVNPAHPHLIDARGKFQILLADAIDLAIEVKPDVSDSSELNRGLVQGARAKKLRRVLGPLLSLKKESPRRIDLSRQIPFFIFAMKAKANIKDTINDILHFYRSQAVSVEDQIDALVVHDQGVLVNVKALEEFPYNWNIPEQEKVGWFFEKWDELTLVGFLFALEMSFHSHATIQQPVLKRYIEQMGISRYVERICNCI